MDTLRGDTLVHFYNTKEKIEELLSLGDIISLGELVKPDINETRIHTFDSPLDNVTVAYHRDRGETLHKAKTFKNIDEVIEYFDWNEYFYVFENGDWYVYADTKTRKLVEDILIEKGDKE